MNAVQVFLGSEILVFAVAALVHADLLLGGHRHRQAGTAEAVIAGVVAVGLVVSLRHPRLSRAAGFGVQGFALLGTFVGVAMIAIGIGPQSVLDVVLHASMITLLAAGLLTTARFRPAVGES